MKKIYLLVLMFLGMYANAFSQVCPIGGGNEGGGPSGGPITDPIPYCGDSIPVTLPVDPNEIVDPTAFMSYTSIGDTVRWVSAEL